MRAIKHWNNISKGMVDLSSLTSLIHDSMPCRKRGANSARRYGLDVGIIGNVLASLCRSFWIIIMAFLAVTNPSLSASNVHMAEL